MGSSKSGFNFLFQQGGRVEDAPQILKGYLFDRLVVDQDFERWEWLLWGFLNQVLVLIVFTDSPKSSYAVTKALVKVRSFLGESEGVPLSSAC